uniref:Poly [ADP-ribose] polymerase n=1 Tax=Echeneis naucrates TaxID=173247 RepID=A0A665VI28_ECHNA
QQKQQSFDYAGVTIFPLTASPQPMVLLQGPAGRMTEVRNRLGPFLDSLVQDIVTISLPAATRYFESSSGRDSILSVANSRKSLIHNGDAPVASYILSDGLQVLVRQGDITKLEADALVNAANEDLDHCGGVALALSKAGGPEIQRESKALVEHIGKIPTGDVVVTTGGNLLCKKLLHAVGPTAGRADGRERLLLEKAVDTALNLSDTMEFRSVAILTAAGPAVKEQLAQTGIPTNFYCTTGPGQLGCREIIHANFSASPDVFRKNCKRILKHCESKGYRSVALPAINTGSYQLPAHWDPMSNEISKRVELNPNSQEYQNVAQGFHKTAKYNIQKIERVQNFFQWHAYSLCKQRILTKNGEADLREMSLYHGTSAKSCDIIEKDRFDRSFAGTNAAVFGKGVYFAVNANYSATFFSTPDTSGLRRLYVARVLTGRYTVGKADMKAPPPRGPDPTDCFDSLVDSQQQPSKFVIFHDDQAYPEYLITFT